MTYGPIDFIALEFKGNKFKGEILNSLLELVDQGIIRIIDLIIILKDEDGEVIVRELQELQPNVIAAFDPLEITVSSLVTTMDIDMIAGELENNSTSGILLIENLWAIKFKEAVLEADGTVVMQERIPHDVIVEALAEMVEIEAQAAAST